MVTSEATDEITYIGTTAKDRLDRTESLTTTSQDQDEVKSDLYFVKEEIKKIKVDISNILKNGGKINISSAFWWCC